MTDKNPYENQDTVDIPDFVEKDDTNNSVDMSVFKMKDEETDEDEYEEEGERKPFRLKNKVVMLGAIALGVMLLILVVLLIFGISRGKALKTLQAQYDTYVADATAKIGEYEAKIQDLNRQIEELKNPTQPVNPDSPTSDSKGKYVITADAINMRTEHEVNADNVYGTFDQDDEVAVEEIYSDGTRTWGKTVFDNMTVWFCISDGTNTYAKKVG